MSASAVQVFISSTSFDLQDERKAVEIAIQRMPQAKYVGMEYFGSRNETTLQASLDEVDRSHVYIGILGDRYGSGITEAEYRRARERNLPCFIYVRSPGSTSKRWQESDPENALRLERFRHELERHHTIAQFGNADQLAAQVTDRIYRWLIDERLTTSPKDAYAIRTDLTPADAQGRRNLSILSQRVHHFWVKGLLDHSLSGAVLLELGKEHYDDLVEQPWERVLQLPGENGRVVDRGKKIIELFDETSRSLLILGEPGSGKTTALLELVRDRRPLRARFP